MNNVTLTLITNPVSFTVLRASFAPSKPTNQLPVIQPDVAIPAKACKQAPTDHTPIAQRNPFLVSNQSTNFPANNKETA
jgi:hypothetical protein